MGPMTVRTRDSLLQHAGSQSSSLKLRSFMLTSLEDATLVKVMQDS